MSVDIKEALDLDIVEKYLRYVGVDVAAPLSARLISGGKSNLTFGVTDGAHRWVVRRPPVGPILPGTHSMAREYRVMGGLRDSRVPVPRMVALCQDLSYLGVEFYVMEELEGRVIRTRADSASLAPPTRRELGRELVDVLAALHDLEPGQFGLGDLGRPDGYLERQLSRWTAQLAEVQTREFEHVDVIARVLSETRPRHPGASLVHGDYRLDNVILAKGDGIRIAGVLDWEMATLGDPLADLGTLLMFWDEPGQRFNPITDGLMALEGFPNRDDVIEQYVSSRGLQLDNLDWYLVFSEFKLAVILEQINARHRRGETMGHGFDGLDQMVSHLFDSARERIARSRMLRQGQSG